MDQVLQQVQFLRPGWGDLAEIAIVFLLIYRVLLLVRETRASQMLLGLLLLGAMHLAATVLGFSLIRSLIAGVFQYGAIAALVVFQPEMRAALARLGESRLVRLLGPARETRIVDGIVEGVVQLSRAGTGAIVAVQRETGLRDYARSGSRVDARLSPELLRSIFAPQSPLHDGAVVVVGDTIRAARAILPLTQHPVPDRSLGTRHRAAIGLSEETDAVVIVVSEETARISLALRGKLEVGVDAQRLREVLERSIPGRPGLEIEADRS